MKEIFSKPQSMTNTKLHYCPGCSHGVAHRLVAEVIDDLDIQERTIGVASVGCSVVSFNYFDCDFQQAAHGRAPAVATGIKRVLPDKIVFTYQGDGDLASIGAGEIIHAAARGENITVIFINNAIYGMTGGQMAPTTLLGQKTSTSPQGRGEANGYPIKVVEMLATLPGTVYATRASLHNPAHILQAKKAIHKAFQNQIESKGFSIVELLSTCPTNWGLSPVDSLQWLKENMLSYFPLGEYKNSDKEEAV